MKNERHIAKASALAVAIGLTLGGCSGATTGAQDETDEHVGSVVVTQWNDSTELFLEYPFLVAGQATGNWAIHLTDMEDYKPIRSGRLTVRFMTADGLEQTFDIDDVARDGIFLLDPVVETPGTYRVELALESPQVNSRHVLPEVTVYASATDLPHAHEEEGGGIAFLKEQQWQIPFDVTEAQVDTVQRTVTVPGEIVAPDGALVEISAPVDGIASVAPNRSAPSVGQRVRAGQVLAVLAPTTQAGGFAAIRARVERLEREVRRAERLFDAGAIPEKRLEEARHGLELARAQAGSMGAAGSPGDYRLRMTAPIAGVVAQRDFIPGGRVEAGARLFTIVDPTTAWLRVQVPASAASSIPDKARATFTVEGSDAVHPTGQLVSVGGVLDPETRTVPAVFEVPDGTRFTIRQLAQAAVPVDGRVTGVVIPNRAIVDDNGTPVTYIQAGGETFERRILTLGVTDGTRTHILAGIEPGEMVVTSGGYQVRLASMSGGEFAGGHAH